MSHLEELAKKLKEADAGFLKALGPIPKTSEHKSTLISFLQQEDIIQYEIQYRFKIFHEKRFDEDLRRLIGFVLGQVNTRLQKVQVLFSQDFSDPCEIGRRLNLEGYFRIITNPQTIESEARVNQEKSKTDIRYEHVIEAIQVLTKRVENYLRGY